MRNQSLAHASSILYGEAWAIQREKLAVLVEVFEARKAGLAKEDADELRAAQADAAKARFPQASMRQVQGINVAQIGRVAVLPLMGTVTQRASVFSRYSGGTSAEQFAAAHEELANDPSISAIVWDVDSPGGSVAGVPEAGDKLYSLRGKKQTVAVSNTMNASAAYWLSSAANEVVVTPSSLTGSIGVFAVHEDYSKANDRVGVRPTYISAGKFKTDGNPDYPITDSARSSMQRRVDAFYGQFVAAVARHRGASESTVRNGYGEGDVLTARDAVAARLADRTDTLDGVIRRLSGARASTAAVADAATLRAIRHHEAVKSLSLD